MLKWWFRGGPESPFTKHRAGKSLRNIAVRFLESCEICLRALEYISEHKNRHRNEFTQLLLQDNLLLHLICNATQLLLHFKKSFFKCYF